MKKWTKSTPDHALAPPLRSLLVYVRASTGMLTVAFPTSMNQTLRPKIPPGVLAHSDKELQLSLNKPNAVPNPFHWPVYMSGCLVFVPLLSRSAAVSG